MPFLPQLYAAVVPLIAIGMAIELSARNDQTTLSTVEDFYAFYGIIPDNTTVGRTSNIVSFLLCLISAVTSGLVISVYLTAPLNERNNLRMKILFGLFIAHFFAAFTLTFLLLFALAGVHPRSGTLLCQFSAVVVQLCQWSEYLWTVTLSWVTYCVIVDPLSIITQSIERKWKYIPPVLYFLAMFFSVLQAGLYGTDYIGGFCYSHARSRKAWNELSVFGPRLLVCIVISSYYILIFRYIRRPRPPILDEPIEITLDPTSQTSATTSTTSRPRSRRRNTVVRVTTILDPSEPTPEPRGTPYPVGRLPTSSTPSLPPSEPERRHNLENIRVGDRMRDEVVNVSRWSESTVDGGKIDLERDPSQATAATSDTALSQGTSAAGSAAPLTREPTTAARPTSNPGSFMNRLSNSFLGWTGWNIGDPTPGTTTTPELRRLTISPRTSAIPEAVASSSGISHSIAMEEPDPNFGGPRIRQRTAPGTDLLDVPAGSRTPSQSHSRSESYPSRSATPTNSGMTPSQSGPARFRYPPLSMRTPSEAWSTANPNTSLPPSGSSGSRPAWDTDDDGGPTYVDYAPARRMAQQIAPVFLIFPLSYILISTVGLARVIHTLHTSRPNPWFHTVSRWTLLLQAPIDAITLLYTARRLGKRLRAIVEEGNNSPVV
ncbi:hypothetical protein FS837_007830 [Tulasnella sp. UAMH 9824]|nr:hypothetical protein FS837_007830 [Tulasnella sp. UAMH 9824]